jgi:Ala-tRNA(Pro) deacylase
MKHEKITKLLDQLGISYKLYKHKPVFTTEEDEGITIPGAHSKNLFVKSKKGYYLISILNHKRVDLKAFDKKYETGRLSFSNEKELLSLLDVTPGSVTPFGLITQKTTSITFFLDEEMLQKGSVNFHPLQNDMTVNLVAEAFLDFLKKIKIEPQIVSIPTL